MRPDELTDDRIDKALRGPRWEPPRYFTRVVVAGMPTASDGAFSAEEPRGSAIVQAVTIGICAAGFACVGGVAIRHAMPVLIMNAEVVGWIGAAAGLVAAAAVSGVAEEWI